MIDSTIVEMYRDEQCWLGGNCKQTPIDCGFT